MATKSVYVGPQDGWTKVITAGAAFAVRISGIPHTHPFFVFSHPTDTPTVADNGVQVCHYPFEISNAPVAGITDAFWVRVVNPVPNSKNMDGKLRIDIYTDGTIT